MIQINNLVKYFGPIKAVDDISFSVNKGDILAFLGPNGAGKSTTIKMVAGFLSPTSGDIKILNKSLVENAQELKMKIGYMPEKTPAYPEMTPREYLRFIAESYEMANPDEAVTRVIKMTNLEKVADQLVDTISKGYRSRLSFASAVIHDPEILLLDEPTDGLDPNQKNEIRILIKKLSVNKGIIISTHLLEEIEAMCNRVVVITEGKVVLDGTPLDLKKEGDYYQKVVISIPTDQQKQVESTISCSLSHFDELGSSNGHTSFLVDQSNNTEEIIDKLTKAHIPFKEISYYKSPLDGAFRKLTRTKE